MQRREFTKAVGGIVGTSAVGGAALVAGTGGASASGTTSFEGQKSATSDDGEVTYVAVQTTGRLTWDGFDTAAKQARMQVYLTLKRGGEALWGENLIYDTDMFDLGDEWGSEDDGASLTGDHEPGQEGELYSDADWGIIQKNGEHHYVPDGHDEPYPLPTNPAPASHLTADEDGSSQDTRVVLRTVYMLFDENGNELTGSEGYPERPDPTSNFVVTVNNEKSTVGFGDEDGGGDSDDTVDIGV